MNEHARISFEIFRNETENTDVLLNETFTKRVLYILSFP